MGLKRRPNKRKGISGLDANAVEEKRRDGQLIGRNQLTIRHLAEFSLPILPALAVASSGLPCGSC